MVGVPKSKACQACKRRRIKCDLSWPTCGPCLRSKVPCSGPSSLVKFVGNDSDEENTGSQRQPSPLSISFTASTRPQVKGIQPPEDVQIVDRSAARNRRNQKSSPSNSSYNTFRLISSSLPPSTNPTSNADRVAHRLARIIERSTSLELSISYLSELPRYLSRSACLRDVVHLLCIAWSDYLYKQHGDGGEAPRSAGFLGMREYGKALRSIQRAIGGQDKPAVETLAAVALLERAQAYFDCEMNSMAHLRGMAMMAEDMGPPKPGDRLHSLVANDIRSVTHGFGTIHGEEDIMKDPAWNEAFQDFKQEYWGTTGLRSLTGQVLGTVMDRYYEFPRWLHCVRDIRANPDNDTAKRLAASLIGHLKIIDAEVRHAESLLTNEALQKGVLTETANDPEGITPTKYSFDSLVLLEAFLTVFTVRIIILRMMNDMGLLYASPDEAAYRSYREACVQVWMTGPFLRTLEPIAAMMYLIPFHITQEAANEREREYVLDLVEFGDSYLGRLPKDRGKLGTYSCRLGDLFTGRYWTEHRQMGAAELDEWLSSTNKLST